VIQQRLENAIAGKILEGGYTDGDTVRVDYAGKAFSFGKVQAKVAAR
jgi:ATP-dependent Clp protease ATP-binding subunit ClpA